MPSRLTSRIFTWTAVAAILIPASAAMAEPDAPSGQELIQQFVELSGGQAAYEKVQNRVIKANLDLSDHGMEGTITEVIAPPNYHREIVLDEYDGIRVVSGVTNGVAWRLNAEKQRAPLEGDEAADLQRHAQLNPFLDWTPMSGEANVVGDANLGEDECYRVEITPANDSPLFAFFSKNTGLLRRIDNKAADAYRYFDDYRKLDGVLVPHVLRFEFGMWMANYESVTIEQNADLDDIKLEDPSKTKASQR